MRQDKDPQMGLLGLWMCHAFVKIVPMKSCPAKVGVYKVNSHLAAVEIRTQDGKVFSCLIDQKSMQESFKLEIRESS
jgi:hypothetical protein